MAGEIRSIGGCLQDVSVDYRVDFCFLWERLDGGQRRDAAQLRCREMRQFAAKRTKSLSQKFKPSVWQPQYRRFWTLRVGGKVVPGSADGHARKDSKDANSYQGQDNETDSVARGAGNARAERPRRELGTLPS